MRRPLAKLFRGEVIANNGSALHDELDGFENVYVGERVATDGVERLHTPLNHLAELSRVVAVGVDAGIRAESYLRAELKSMAEILTLQAADFLFLFYGFREHSHFRAVLRNVVVVVNVEDEKGAVLLGEGDAFVVDQAGMFDGVDAGADGVLDGLRAVGVRGDLATELVGFFGDGLHFFECVLGCAGLIAFTEDAAGGADLDDIGAVLGGFPDFGASGPGAIGNAFRLVVIFGREQIVVALAARDAKRRAGSAHSRTFDVAGVDGVAECDVRVTARADVSNGGEAGAQRKPSVLHPGNGFARNRNSEARVAAGGGIRSEMGMNVNQTGEAGGV